jgi:sec-independent protein translocase protein TatA
MNIGLPEILGVLALALLLFGAKKLPELGSSVGQSIRNFKRGVHEAEAEDTPKDASREDATGRREL